jgi:hypothetical protein
MLFDDFDERLAEQLEKRASQLTQGRGRLYREAAKMLRDGNYTAGSVGVWLERELALEERVEEARWAAVPD